VCVCVCVCVCDSGVGIGNVIFEQLLTWSDIIYCHKTTDKY
jgi:hypothetical protein